MPDNSVNVLVAHDPRMTGAWVTDHIPRESGVDITEVLDSLSPDAEAIRASDADLLIVACSEHGEDALHLVEWWAGHRRGKPIIVLCQESPNGFVQRAFAAGADDLVVLEGGSEVSPETTRSVGFALQKAVVRRVGPPEEHGHGSRATVVCVLGPKGGVGKTVTADNLALSLVGRRNRVALVDLDLQFGDVALSLGLRPERSIYDLTVSGGSLDAGKVEAYLTEHPPSGLQVLAAPVRPDQAEMVTPEFTSDIVETLRTAFDFVVIDTPPLFSPEVISAIDASTYVCVVGMLDALSLKNTRLGLETLDLMGYPRERIRVLLNRANTSVGITGQDVISILGRPPDVLVPSSRDVTRSVNEGEPIVLSNRRSDAAKAFNALGELFVPAKTAGRRRGLLGRSRG